MKKLIIASSVILLLSGCSGLGSGKIDLGLAIDAGSDLFNAATVSEAEIKNLGKQLAQSRDQRSKVAPASNKYAKRLAKLTAGLQNDSGLNLNFKAYISKETNAFTYPDGSVRVYTALMDMMTDVEIIFIIGHEIGHVKNGDSAAETRTGYITAAARKGVAAQSNLAGNLAASELGGLAELVVNAQYSQSQERAADDFGMAFLKRLGRSEKAAVTCLRKLAELGDRGSILASHPSSSSRAERLEKKLAA